MVSREPAFRTGPYPTVGICSVRADQRALRKPIQETHSGNPQPRPMVVSGSRGIVAAMTDNIAGPSQPTPQSGTPQSQSPHQPDPAQADVMPGTPIANPAAPMAASTVGPAAAASGSVTSGYPSGLPLPGPAPAALPVNVDPAPAGRVASADPEAKRRRLTTIAVGVAAVSAVVSLGISGLALASTHDDRQPASGGSHQMWSPDDEDDESGGNAQDGDSPRQRANGGSGRPSNSGDQQSGQSSGTQGLGGQQPAPPGQGTNGQWPDMSGGVGGGPHASSGGS